MSRAKLVLAMPWREMVNGYELKDVESHDLKPDIIFFQYNFKQLLTIMALFT